MTSSCIGVPVIIVVGRMMQHVQHDNHHHHHHHHRPRSCSRNKLGSPVVDVQQHIRKQDSMKTDIDSPTTRSLSFRLGLRNIRNHRSKSRTCDKTATTTTATFQPANDGLISKSGADIIDIGSFHSLSTAPAAMQRTSHDADESKDNSKMKGRSRQIRVPLSKIIGQKSRSSKNSNLSNPNDDLDDDSSVSSTSSAFARLLMRCRQKPAAAKIISQSEHGTVSAVKVETPRPSRRGVVRAKSLEETSPRFKQMRLRSMSASLLIANPYLLATTDADDDDDDCSDISCDSDDHPHVPCTKCGLLDLEADEMDSSENTFAGDVDETKGDNDSETNTSTNDAERLSRNDEKCALPGPRRSLIRSLSGPVRRGRSRGRLYATSDNNHTSDDGPKHDCPLSPTITNRARCNTEPRSPNIDKIPTAPSMSFTRTIRRSISRKASGKRLMANDVNGQENRVEIPILAEPATSNICTPQQHLDAILKERGYNAQRYSALSTGYYNAPTPLQRVSYSVDLIKIILRPRLSDMAELQSLLTCGISPTPCNEYGETLLHRICRKGGMNGATLLNVFLDAGSTIQVCDNRGRTPLHDACWCPMTSETGFELFHLIMHCDPWMLHLEDKQGLTPLDFVRQEQYSQWISFLDSIKDKYWPQREQESSDKEDMDKNSLINQLPNSCPVKDPPNALPLRVAEMVATGRLEPDEARLLVRAQTRKQRSRSRTRIGQVQTTAESHHDSDASGKGICTVGLETIPITSQSTEATMGSASQESMSNAEISVDEDECEADDYGPEQVKKIIHRRHIHLARVSL
jgi:hypothetical protein